MIDNIMIPITIVITFVAVVPFLVGDYPMQDLWQQDEITQYVPNNSYETDKIYFEQLDENIKEAKQSVRDLMAEHEANNP